MYNSFMGEWTVQESEKQLECKVHFRNIYPDIARSKMISSPVSGKFFAGFQQE